MALEILEARVVGFRKEIIEDQSGERLLYKFVVRGVEDEVISIVNRKGLLIRVVGCVLVPFLFEVPVAVVQAS